jgi:hypothetical protein
LVVSRLASPPTWNASTAVVVAVRSRNWRRDAFVIGSNYDDEYKCMHTASISKSEMTDDEVPEQSLNEKDSPSNSSQPQMEESTPQKVSMSNPQSTDVQ